MLAFRLFGGEEGRSAEQIGRTPFCLIRERKETMKLPLKLLGLFGLLLAVSSAGLQRPGQSPTLPDPKLTPGDTLDVSVQDICTPGYTKKIRNVPAEVKRQVYAEYGIQSHQPGEYEVDHLISLEIGGSNSIKNLWPQSYQTSPWNAHVKDKLENRLHKLVCSGQLDLQTAQHAIAANWITAYQKYMGHALPTADRKSTRTGKRRGLRRQESPPVANNSPGNTSGQVWVNTRSGIYWRPGTRYYGKTKEGKYMSEQEAIQEGYHPAGGGR